MATTRKFPFSIWPDRKPWMPPLTDPRDGFLKSAPTRADDAAVQADTPITSVIPKNFEPGPSEFSWGKGLMAPIAMGHEPTQVEQLKAVQRTNPADPGAEPSYDEWIRE